MKNEEKRMENVAAQFCVYIFGKSKSATKASATASTKVYTTHINVVYM